MRYAATLLLLLFGCSCHVYAEPGAVGPATQEKFPLAWVLGNTYQVSVDCADDSLDTGGSAVAIGDSWVVTAKHVVEPFDASCKIELTAADSGRKFEAFLVSKHVSEDIALLVTPTRALPIVGFGDLDLGLDMVAVGYPGGTLSITYGNVASLPDEDRQWRITAPTWYGSSGGGAWDRHGRLLGLTVAMYTNRDNWGLVVPITAVRDLF